MSAFPLESIKIQAVEPTEHPVAQTLSVHVRVCNHAAFLLDFQMMHFSEQDVFFSSAGTLATNLNALYTPGRSHT